MVSLPKERRWTPATTMSFSGAVAAGLIILLVWLMWPGGQEARVAYQRKLEEVTVRWRCQAGHVQESAGSAEPKTCPECGKPSDIVMNFTCPEHGANEFFIRYRKLPKGRAEPDRYSIDGRTWQQSNAPPLCKECGKPMLRKEIGTKKKSEALNFRQETNVTT